jgi:hypothetical protein
MFASPVGAAVAHGREHQRRNTSSSTLGSSAARAACHSVAAAGIVKDVSGLESDEPAVRASERDDFGRGVDRSWRNVEKRDAFLPAVPVLVTAERAVLPRAAASEEVEEVFSPIRHSLRSWWFP